MELSANIISFTTSPIENQFLDIEGSNFGPNRELVIVGFAEDIKSSLENILDTVCSKQEWPVSLLNNLIDNASVSSYLGTSITTMVENSLKPDSFISISCVIVPRVSSRHNSVFRQDIIYEQLPKVVKNRNKSSSNNNNNVDENNNEENVTLTKTTIVFITDLTKLEKEDDKIGLYCSLGGVLGRSFPSFSKKKGSKATNYIQASFYDFEKQTFLNEEEKDILDCVKSSSRAVRMAANLVDRPCNHLYTTDFVNHAKKELSRVLENNPELKDVLSIEVIEGEELLERGLNGIYSVGKAAVNPPALAILKYEPAQYKKTIAWCGKGIVYDTGGFSMKTKTTMPGMKRDMGGAAAMCQAFFSAVEQKLNFRLYTLLCLAENSVGPKATLPDDIITFYSGVTVEINNTDAEGRLVLGDGVAYAAKNLNCDAIFNMCTLTGAQGVSTGRRHAAIVCNNDDLETTAIRAGKISGDLTHPLPYCPEFFKDEFKSYVADIKNSVRNRNNAQSSCAAQFIACHIDKFLETKDWLHVDMASPAKKGELATGYGCLLLLQILRDLE
eukprot:TRINITY_DN1171_c4_g1_i1.p1 TRINITY_DN1171_c4_g1~~TRINITY_DN1171_c4_g1_i1.p1  ORF type:complete len:556 (-),score=181.52 TRINITY_DN1171_c4_g1_i1:60-1727(-)